VVCLASATYDRAIDKKSAVFCSHVAPSPVFTNSARRRLSPTGFWLKHELLVHQPEGQIELATPMLNVELFQVKTYLL
jgi:hypothetical protein